MNIFDPEFARQRQRWDEEFATLPELDREQLWQKIRCQIWHDPAEVECTYAVRASEKCADRAFLKALKIQAD